MNAILYRVRSIWPWSRVTYCFTSPEQAQRHAEQERAAGALLVEIEAQPPPAPPCDSYAKESRLLPPLEVRSVLEVVCYCRDEL